LCWRALARLPLFVCVCHVVNFMFAVCFQYVNLVLVLLVLMR